MKKILWVFILLIFAGDAFSTDYLVHRGFSEMNPVFPVEDPKSLYLLSLLIGLVAIHWVNELITRIAKNKIRCRRKKGMVLSMDGKAISFWLIFEVQTLYWLIGAKIAANINNFSIILTGHGLPHPNQIFPFLLQAQSPHAVYLYDAFFYGLIVGYPLAYLTMPRLFERAIATRKKP